MFNTLKATVAKRFAAMVKQGQLFVVKYDRDDIWYTYLRAYPQETQQEHNCNCCKSFIRQMGGVVFIDKNNQLQTLWDVPMSGVPEEYQASIVALHNYILGCPVDGVFSHEEKEAGKDKNFSDKHKVIFHHFNVQIPKELMNSAVNNPAASGTMRSSQQVFLRALNEITPEAIATVLELNSTKTLYNGAKYTPVVKAFQEVQTAFLKLPEADRVNFAWRKTSQLHEGVTHIRNHAIGTLLQDLSENMDFNVALDRFQKGVMAPENFMRPKATIATPRAIEAARKTMTDAGMTCALERRILDSRDLGPHNTLFTHRPKAKVVDAFSALTGPAKVAPKTLEKVEEISIEAFLEKVLPTAQTIRVMMEEDHLQNLVTLTGPVDPESKSIMKWENSFGWSYSGGVADSLRSKVAKLGGRVDGPFRFSHTWNYDGMNQSLMDLHVFMPGCKVEAYPPSKEEVHNNYPAGRRIGWNARDTEKRSGYSGGEQDVDHVNEPGTTAPVENIAFPDINRMPEGRYVLKVHNWQHRPVTKSGFKAEIELNGKVHRYEHKPGMKSRQWITVAEVELRKKEFTIKHLLPPASDTVTKWGITTGTWRNVKHIALSPNHWTNPSGEKHFFFLLEGCVSDERTRPFYNEFLLPELNKDHRKVMEILADKLDVLPAEGAELSGLGFSETKRSHLIVEVTGTITRVLKVLF